jgi:hypothetical protein
VRGAWANLEKEATTLNPEKQATTLIFFWAGGHRKKNASWPLLTTMIFVFLNSAVLLASQDSAHAGDDA